MIRGGRFTEALMAGAEAERLLLHDPWYRRIFDAVRASEYDGHDPLPVLVDGLARLARSHEELQKRVVEYEQKLVRPMYIFEEKP